MLSRFKSALVLSPHVDDGELGAGGTIARLIAGGARVYYNAFSTARQSVPDGYPPDILKTEVVNATSALGIRKEDLTIHDYEVRKLGYTRQEILEDLIAQKDRLNPDLVLMPTLQDIHQDHAVVAHEGLRAFKNTTILGYELIWNNVSFDATAFVSLQRRDVELKLEALQRYRSQSGRRYMDREFILALAKARGVQVGVDYAESFEVVRWVMR